MILLIPVRKKTKIGNFSDFFCFFSHIKTFHPENLGSPETLIPSDDLLENYSLEDRNRFSDNFLQNVCICFTVFKIAQKIENSRTVFAFCDVILSV